jgi:hypothetical protein
MIQCAQCGQAVSEADQVIHTERAACHQYCVFDDLLLAVSESHLPIKVVAVDIYGEQERVAWDDG